MSDVKLTVAILVVSDTASADETSDKCAPILREALENAGNATWEVVKVHIVPDNVQDIQSFIKQHADGEQPPNLIVTSGGTGFASKDNTPEAVSPLLHRHASGLVHGMLTASLTITPFAMMSRPVAGTRHKTLIITLPGSPKGAKENLDAVLKQLPHACLQAAGVDSRSLHEGGVKKLEQEAGINKASKSHPKGTCDHHFHHHSHSEHSGPVPHTKQDSNLQSNDPNAGPSRRHRSSPYPMVSVSNALDIIKHQTPPSSIGFVPVNGNLVGLVLAEDVKAQESVPAFRASIVDGYAVHIPSNERFQKGVYTISQISHAKAADTSSLKDGTVARITTGAPLPPGANAVVMVEDTIVKSRTEDDREEKEIEIQTDQIAIGENVREVGSDVQAGDIIIAEGEGVTATGGELGLLASAGVQQVQVYQSPVVGVLSTGDELVQHSQKGPLHHGEVRDTNRPTLLAAIRGCGFQAVDLGIASDRPGALEETLRSAFTTVDVVITSGGVSMGELDPLKPTIERALGGTIHFGRVNMKPGKPTTFASIQVKIPETGERKTKLIFALPGNPASAIVTFHLFVLPSLHHASHIEPAGLPKVTVVLDGDVRCDAQRPEFQRVTVTAKSDGLLYATSTGGQRSSRIGSFKGANALLCVPAGKGIIVRGEKLEALMMGNIFSGLI